MVRVKRFNGNEQSCSLKNGRKNCSNTTWENVKEYTEGHGWDEWELPIIQINGNVLDRHYCRNNDFWK